MEPSKGNNSPCAADETTGGAMESNPTKSLTGPESPINFEDKNTASTREIPEQKASESPNYQSTEAVTSAATDIPSVDADRVSDTSQAETCVKRTLSPDDSELSRGSENGEPTLHTKQRKVDTAVDVTERDSEATAENVTVSESRDQTDTACESPPVTPTSQVSMPTDHTVSKVVPMSEEMADHVTSVRAEDANVNKTLCAGEVADRVTSVSDEDANVNRMQCAGEVADRVTSVSDEDANVKKTSRAGEVTDHVTSVGNEDVNVKITPRAGEVADHVTSVADEDANVNKTPRAGEETEDGTGTSESVEMEDTEVRSVIYNVSKPPEEIAGSWSEFSRSDNYLKGCKWSPDGSCLLTCSNDCSLRLFNLPEALLSGQIENLDEMVSVLRIQESDTVYDYCWYPCMSSADPPSCCFVTTSANTPVHLWDAFTGELRCSYRPYNQVDEVTPPHCVSFSPDGSKLYCGFNKIIRVFDVNRPGRDCQERKTYEKEGQAGIISCIASSPEDPRMYAAGSYSRSIALYCEPRGEMVCMFQGHQGGITHIMFSADGTKLLSGGRKDPEILCWDLRNPGQILFVAQRLVETNQRIYFDTDQSGRYLISGNHDGTIRIWDTTLPTSTVQGGVDPVLEPVLKCQTHPDTVNGVSLHPSMPLLATSSGQRHFKSLDTGSDEETEEAIDKIENSVKLWYL